MTQRRTVSLPDELAARMDQEDNASAFIAGLIREQLRREQFRQFLLDEGFPLTPQGKAEARSKLSAAQEAAGPHAAGNRQLLREQLGIQVVAE